MQSQTTVSQGTELSAGKAQDTELAGGSIMEKGQHLLSCSSQPLLSREPRVWGRVQGARKSGERD